MYPDLPKGSILPKSVLQPFLFVILHRHESNNVNRYDIFFILQCNMFMSQPVFGHKKFTPQTTIDGTVVFFVYFC